MTDRKRTVRERKGNKKGRALKRKQKKNMHSREDLCFNMSQLGRGKTTNQFQKIKRA